MAPLPSLESGDEVLAILDDCRSCRTPPQRSVDRRLAAARARTAPAASTCWPDRDADDRLVARRLAAVAEYTLGIGTCAAFGGDDRGGQQPHRRLRACSLTATSAAACWAATTARARACR